MAADTHARRDGIDEEGFAYLQRLSTPTLLAIRFAAKAVAILAVIMRVTMSMDAQTPVVPPLREGLHDFDFIHGTWEIHNRRLKQPLSGSNDWYEFEGRSVERSLWGGQANLEEYEATLPDQKRIRGLALRLYDPASKHWTIHWSNSADGTLIPPMSGTFRDGLGEFYSHEDYHGRMILVRFQWRSLDPNNARWEQAFSADGGRSWETNWIMDFKRKRDAERPPDRENAEAEVRTLNQQYIDAARSRDATWFREHMAENVVVILGGGRRLTRAEFLATMSDEPRSFVSLTLRDVTIRVFGPTVQVDADASWELEDGTRGVSRYIDTYAWIDGRWQVVSAQITPLR